MSISAYSLFRVRLRKTGVQGVARPVEDALQEKRSWDSPEMATTLQRHSLAVRTSGLRMGRSLLSASLALCSNREVK